MLSGMLSCFQGVRATKDRFPFVTCRAYGFAWDAFSYRFIGYTYSSRGSFS